MKETQSQLFAFMVSDMEKEIIDAFQFEESRERAREAIREEEEQRLGRREESEPLPRPQNIMAE